MVDDVGQLGPDEVASPEERLGLPRTGRGSLASWQSRVVALLVDWAASMAVAAALFGSGVLFAGGWRGWMILAVFFVESAVLSVFASASLGQLVCRLAIVRLDAKPLGFLRGTFRAVLVCLVLPVLVVGADRRGLHDVVVGTALVNRR